VSDEFGKSIPLVGRSDDSRVISRGSGGRRVGVGRPGVVGSSGDGRSEVGGGVGLKKGDETISFLKRSREMEGRQTHGSRVDWKKVSIRRDGEPSDSSVDGS